MSIADLVNPNVEGLKPWDAAPYPSKRWAVISEEDADYCLNVLPPLMFSGGFAVCEPHTHDPEAVYLAVVRVWGKFYARHLHRFEMEAEARALRDALGA